MVWRITVRLARSLPTVGLLLGTVFFAASLTPSLLPRPPMMQGVVSGLSFAAGYGVGVGLRWVWTYMQLPRLSGRWRLAAFSTASVLCAATAFVFLWRATEWQNSTRALMDLPPVEGIHPFYIAVVAAGVFALLIAVGRLFQWTFRLISEPSKRVAPHRVANVVGFVAAVAIFWSLADGLLVRAAMRAADSSFQQLDALLEAGIEMPSSPLRTGSTASLVDWEQMGRKGREFVSSGPKVDTLARFAAGGVREPVRVYVGLNSAETVGERARLALEELIRVNAFDRAVLVIATPTGTGWIDPPAIASLEYLHGGDVASVAVQYSYLASWLSLLVEPDYGAETARALFNEVYGYWRTLPRDRRPKLYLHGLSLGALNSDLSADFFDVIADPFHGALWSGPPFSTATWRLATQGREQGSPYWLPRFRDGSVIRFTNQSNALRRADSEWGPVRIAFLQYASDPVTFFSPEILYRRPDWLAGRRGPDVSERLRWFPFVTFFQLMVDIPASMEVPVGYGHVYAPEHYIDAWFEITDAPGWSDAKLDRLKAHLRHLKAR